MEELFGTLSFWHWLILGVLLLLLELTTGGGFLLWVAISSFFVAALTFCLPNLDWPWQMMWFSLLSLVVCYGWRRYLKSCTEHSDKPNLNQRMQQYIGREFVLTEAIENGRGKVKVGDTYWLVSGPDLAQGHEVKVVGVDGALLIVEPAE